LRKLDESHGNKRRKLVGSLVRFKASKCESWRTKRERSWEKVGAFWEEIHGAGKHIKGEYL